MEREGDLTFKELSKNALKKANRTLVEASGPTNSSEAKPFHMGYLSGFRQSEEIWSPPSFRESF